MLDSSKRYAQWVLHSLQQDLLRSRHAPPGRPRRRRPRHPAARTPDLATDRLAALADDLVDHRWKGLPPDAAGSRVGALAGARRDLFTGGFTTPVLALSAEAVEHNLRQLEDYTERHGLAFAPHGKTSMAPQLFARQLAYGAWASPSPYRTRCACAGSSACVASSSPTSWWTPPPCAGSPVSWRPTRTSGSSATSTPYAASP